MFHLVLNRLGKTWLATSFQKSCVLMLFVASTCFSSTAFALSVTASPTNCVNNSSVGTQGWSVTGNALSSNDGYATASVDDNQHSNLLLCSGYGFSIPADATITGITVGVERKSSGTITRDDLVRLVKGGAVGTTDRSTTTNYGTADAVELHGSATDLWGTTWTPANVNATSFGAAFAAQKAGTSGGVRTVSVDHVQITVYYTVPFVCAPPSNTPGGLALTCVCDTFARPALQPSTIFGSNWIVSTSDSTGILPSIVNSGYLRLTNNTGNNAKAATVPGIFPAAGNYISVEFQHFAYNGSGADGIAVTLSDYSVPAVPGAYGGSLGYAQETGIHDGFAGGWLGVALDEYGNYQNTNEGRLGGPGFTSQSVGARGSGSGQAGYRWLGGSASLTPTIDDRTSTTPSRGYFYQIIVDARSEPTGTAVSVNRDTGGGYQQLISIPNVYTAAVANGFVQAPVPANWQVSFTGSTGGSTNIHEISSLRICASTVVPPGGGTASGFSVIDDNYGAVPLSDVQKYLTGHIFMKLVGTPFKLNVAAIANSQIVTTYAATGTKNVTVKLVNNSDNACILDSSKPNYCSSACRAKGAVAGGSQILDFKSVNAGQKQSADFTLNTAYSNLVAIISDGTTTACSTDSFSVRPTGFSSVTSSNATNSSTGGSLVFKAGSDTFSLTLTATGISGVAAGYSGVAKVNNAVIVPVSPATVAGIIAPATFPAAISGSGSSSATGGTFTYSEVGSLVLPGYNPASDSGSPRGVYDGVQTATECASLSVAQCDSLKLASSWTGVDSVSTASDCIPDSYSNTKVGGKYGCNFGLVANTAGFGRFVPNEFVVLSPVLTNRRAASCVPPSVFSYLDEGMRLQFTLQARAGGGNITKNYAGALAKLPLAANGSELNFGAAVPIPFLPLDGGRIYGSGFPTTWPPLGDASAGTVAFDGTLTVSSLNSPASNRVTPDGPFNNLALGIAPVDPDGVRILAYDLDTDNLGGMDHKILERTTLYFGQLRLIPVIGSELLPLAMRIEVQRWNGSAFVTNGFDSCTQIPVSSIGLTNPGGTGLTSGDVSLVLGVGAIGLSAPGAGNGGPTTVTVDVTGAGMPYLGGRWPGATAYDRNPSAVAGFGLYKNSGRIIHLRENY